MSGGYMSDEVRTDNANSGRANAVRFIRDPGGWMVPTLISGVLHGAAVLMLWGGGWPEPQANAPAPRVQTQLMTLTYEVAEPLPAVAPPPVKPPPVEPPPAIEPEPIVDQAAIARKRLDEQARKREEEHRKEEQRKEEERREEVRQEQLAEKKRLAEQQRQHEQELARQQAEEDRRAEQRARQAQAQAAADAEAEFMAQYQPITKAPPAYPRRALDSRIEGDCTVSYTVTPDGRVSKPTVLEEACDDPIFIRPSLQAASAFHYQPRIVNGRAVAVHDVRNTFRYRIQ